MQDEYRRNLQLVKSIIFQIFLQKNNIWMTRKEIEDMIKQKNETILVQIQDVIEDSLYHYQQNDEYRLTTDIEQTLSKQILTNQTKYRLKTENITNKDQLIEYLSDKKSIIYVNSIWFESCYPEMKRDLDNLISESKLLVSLGRDNKKQYIYIDTVFKNYQEKKIFKEDPLIKKMIQDAKSLNETAVSEKQSNNSNQQQRTENIRKTTPIQNDWIEGLKQELQKR